MVNDFGVCWPKFKELIAEKKSIENIVTIRNDNLSILVLKLSAVIKLPLTKKYLRRQGNSVPSRPVLSPIFCFIAEDNICCSIAFRHPDS